MEEFKANWKKSIFSRLVITFLLIIFPIYVLSIGIYNWAIQTQKESISNTMLSQVNFYMNNLEKEIQRIKLLQYYCTGDVNLQQLASVPQSLDDYEKTRAILLLQQHLQAIASSSTYIASVSAYIPSINRVVSSITYESSIPKDEFDILDVNSNNTMGAQTIYWNNRLFLSVTNLSNSPINIDNRLKKKPEYIIAVELDMKTLKNALKQFNNYEDGGALLIDLQNNFMLTSTNNTDENAAISRFIKQTVKSAKSGSGTVKINGKSYWTIFTSSDYLGITLSKFIPEREVLKNFQKYFIWFWIFTATSVLLILLYSFSTYRLIYKPLSQLVKSFRKMEKGDLNITLTPKKDDEFGYLYGSFNQMVCKLRVLIDQMYKQKILAQNAQLKQLQTQINPHFLYNSYFILHRMIVAEDNENAVCFSRQLGNYLKFITRSGADEVTLASETDHARIYTEIQGMRFVSRMKIEFEELPEEYRDILVPRLIIQPIIENALEHGLENKSTDGLLIVSFHKSVEALDIIVEDNGNGLNDHELEAIQQSLIEKDNIDEVETTGIINIHRRLQFKFGNESGLIFSRSELGGLRVVIRIVSKRGER